MLAGALCAAMLSIILTGCATAARRAPTAATPQGPHALTAADVRDVLASMDATDSTYTTYRVDFPAYAASILRQGPVYVDVRDRTWGPSMFNDPRDPRERPLSAADASSVVADAVSVFRRIQTRKGVSAAILAMTSQGLGGEQGDPPPTNDELLLGMLDGASATSDFMFGQPDPRGWTWRVAGVSIEGSDTARVAYAVASPAGADWRFTQASFTKVLRFERGADSAWLLDGWPNYASFEAEVRRSIEPSTVIPTQSTWWEALGAE